MVVMQNDLYAMQAQQAASLQTQLSCKEKFITTLRRTITSAGSDTGNPLQG